MDFWLIANVRLWGFNPDGTSGSKLRQLVMVESGCAVCSSSQTCNGLPRHLPPSFPLARTRGNNKKERKRSILHKTHNRMECCCLLLLRIPFLIFTSASRSEKR